MSECQAKTADGSPCGAPAQTGKAYCFQHDPEQEAARVEARNRGGAARAAQLSGATVPNLTTAEAVRDYLARVARDTEAQLIPPRNATAIASLCRVQLEAIARAAREEDDRENRRRWPGLP